jgi:hypothetical protein
MKKIVRISPNPGERIVLERALSSMGFESGASAAMRTLVSGGLAAHGLAPDGREPAVVPDAFKVDLEVVGLIERFILRSSVAGRSRSVAATVPGLAIEGALRSGLITLSDLIHAAVETADYGMAEDAIKRARTMSDVIDLFACLDGLVDDHPEVVPPMRARCMALFDDDQTAVE